MKLNKLKDSLVGLAIVLFFNGCNSLDISNLWNYDAELVWNDDNLATAYVTDLYGDIFKGWDTGADDTAEQQTGIPFMLSTITTSGSGYKRWNYTNIRNINLGIEYLAEGTCSESVKNSLTGQMLFMRAYQYGEMIVYHGGMPYITKVQDKDKDDLFVTRNSTAECFDLLIKDLDDAISLLPAKAKGNDYGRISALQRLIRRKCYFIKLLRNLILQIDMIISIGMKHMRQQKKLMIFVSLKELN